MTKYDMESAVREYLHTVAPEQFPRGYKIELINRLDTNTFEARCGATMGYARISETDLDRHFQLASEPLLGHRDGYNTREMQLRGELAAVKNELADLRKRFESLFRVPAHTQTDAEQLPGTPEQWRIRIHVPAFTVETTMGTLAAARGKPAVALTWGQQHQRASEMVAAARDESLKHIATYIVAEGHRVESAEPPEPVEYRFQDEK
jgi:hypothetical protein